MSSYVGAETGALRQLEAECGDAEQEVARARAGIEEALALAGVADESVVALAEVEAWLGREGAGLRRRASSLQGEGADGVSEGSGLRRGWWRRSWLTTTPGARVGRFVVDVWERQGRQVVPLTGPSLLPRSALIEAWPLPTWLGRVEDRRSYGAFPDSLERVRPKTGRPRWRDGKSGDFYEWDPSHGGELEGYNKRGKHIGVFDPETGELVKDPVPGRESPP